MPRRSETDSTTRLNNAANAESGDHGQDEDARDAHQHEVHELRMRRGSAALDLEGRLEADADGGHHPGRSPEERDQEQEPQCGKRRGDLLDRAAHVLLARRGDRQDVEELVDHGRPELVVLEDEAEDRDEQDRQREEREEHVEADRRRVLRATVAKEVLDRVCEIDDVALDRVERRPQESRQASARLHRSGLGHELSLGRA